MRYTGHNAVFTFLEIEGDGKDKVNDDSFDYHWGWTDMFSVDKVAQALETIRDRDNQRGLYINGRKIADDNETDLEDSRKAGQWLMVGGAWYLIVRRDVWLASDMKMAARLELVMIDDVKMADEG